VSSRFVGGGEEILVGGQGSGVPVEPDADDLVGESSVDDILEPFPVASCGSRFRVVKVVS
jgi:hypothetical protein